MRLTKNFTLEEFIRSQTAKTKGLKNEPNEEHIRNLLQLTQNLLQPLRNIYQEPFIVSSGFRSLELNEAVGGVSSSQHLKGMAADIKVKDPRALLHTLANTDLEFDQAILYPTFLHLSYNGNERNRNQILYAKGVKSNKSFDQH